MTFIVTRRYPPNDATSAGGAPRARASQLRVVAFADLSLEVGAGRVTVLLGNGAGKTTALRILTGALEVEGGTVQVLGMDPATDGEEVCRRTGVVAAKPALYDRLTGRDNLRWAAELWNMAPSAPIEAAAARFGISGALGEHVGVTPPA